MKKFFLTLFYLVRLHVIGIYGYAITWFVIGCLHEGAFDWIALMIVVPAPIFNWPYTDLYYESVRAWHAPQVYSGPVIVAVASYMIPVACVVGLRYFLRYRRSEKKPAPLICRKCGYDLRATPERCPECGAASDFRRRSFRIECRPVVVDDSAKEKWDEYIFIVSQLYQIHLNGFASKLRVRRCYSPEPRVTLR